MLLKRHWIYEISWYNEFNTVDLLTQEIVLNFLPEYHNDMYMLDKLYWKCSWINLTLLKVQNKQKINIREWGHNFLQNIFEFNARTRLTKWRCVCFVTSVGDSLCVFVLQVVLHRGPSPSRPAWHSTPPPWSPSPPTPQSPTKITRRTMKFRKNNYSPPHTHTSQTTIYSHVPVLPFQHSQLTYENTTDNLSSTCPLPHLLPTTYYCVSSPNVSITKWLVECFLLRRTCSFRAQLLIWSILFYW